VLSAATAMAMMITTVMNQKNDYKLKPTINWWYWLKETESAGEP